MKVRIGATSIAGVTLAALLSTGVAIASGGTDQQAIVVTITVVDGALVASPDPVTVNRRQEVEWQSDLQNFTIQIPHADEPFGNAARQRGLKGRGNARARGRMRPNMERGKRYKYNIAAFNGEEVLFLDPDIIVGPG